MKAPIIIKTVIFVNVNDLCS